jgi:hypothetical protein
MIIKEINELRLELLELLKLQEGFISIGIGLDDGGYYIKLSILSSYSNKIRALLPKNKEVRYVFEYVDSKRNLK